MTEHKRNEDNSEEVGIISISMMIRTLKEITKQFGNGAWKPTSDVAVSLQTQGQKMAGMSEKMEGTF
jgi:hypothetical protein